MASILCTILSFPIMLSSNRMVPWLDAILLNSNRIVDGMDPPKPTKPAAFVEIYQTLPQHTEEEKNIADSYKDPEQDKSPCNKDYPEDSGTNGGFCHISCMHGIMKGATALKKVESPGVFVKVLVKRLPKQVKAAKRIFIYDNACNAHKW